MKRKRKPQQSSPYKRPKFSNVDELQTRKSRVLSVCYPSVLSLRDYLRARLPSNSSRRRHLSLSLGSELDAVLDEWMVGILVEPSPEVARARSNEFAAFTQTQLRASLSQSARTQNCTLEDVLEFVVWRIFNSCNDRAARPKHVLCNGLQKGVPHEGSPIAPGIIRIHPNGNLETLKSSSWKEIFARLGAGGEPILSGLLLDCGLFSKLASGEDNFYQISGIPLNELKRQGTQTDLAASKGATPAAARNPSSITFIRNRILYSKPSLTGKGTIRSGLKHIHVLQRYADLRDPLHVVHFTKHLFPRQFGLHNVFTSDVDKAITSHPFLDYVYREDEIAAHIDRPKLWLPRRLRGRVLDLARSIRSGHARCSYVQLFLHYCALRPVESSCRETVKEIQYSGSSGFITQVRASPGLLTASAQPCTDQSYGGSFLTYATPTAHVAAFCKAVFRSVLPKNALGFGDDGEHNWRLILQQVDAFISMRRFESTSLHHVCQHIRLNCIEWLVPNGMHPRQRPSQQDRDKRLHLLWEFVYYLFDSFLVPLIQTNFYVTESATERNRLFYFRHDVWRKLAEPSLFSLRTATYQQLRPAEVRRLLNARSLGYSHVRLLPKSEGTRTITNLRRRMVKTVKGRRILGASINAQLAPVFGALSSEGKSRPAQLGGAILSVGGLHERLKRFKRRIASNSHLYFVKVDVQSCFDSIPQQGLLDMIGNVLDTTAYRTTRYIETKSMGSLQTRQKYLNTARPADADPAFSEQKAEELSADKVGRVFSEVGYQRIWSKNQLLELLQQHIRNNVVKIGKKHYRQSVGIPQGSVLSSLLCSFFYTSFETDQLNFIHHTNSLLVRLIDDFLLITTDLSTARRFLKVMTAPQDKYGIVVNPDKTLTNFEATSGAHKIPRHVGHTFPYCGMMIDMANLQIGKDRRKRDAMLSNGLTVDFTRKAGLVFERKVRLSLVQQLLRMLLDEALNAPKTILATLMEASQETAMKMYRYIHHMSAGQRPSQRKLIQLFDGLICLGVRYGREKRASQKRTSTGSLKRVHIIWALAGAFEHVFRRKQTQFHKLLDHVERHRRNSETRLGIGSKALSKMVAQRNAVFLEYVY